MSFDSRILTGVGVLAAVTESGNFARAAVLMGMTPSGVSRAVARLEARLGVRLFDRNARAATLTEEGRRFHAQVAPLLDGIEDAAIAVSGAAAAVSGRLRINVDPWFARMVLARHLPAFLAAHPALAIELMVSNHREEMMIGTDVALRFGPAEGASLMVRKLLDTRVVTCASPDYLARRGTPEAPQSLAGHDLVLFRDPHTGRPFDWGYARDGEEIEVAARGRIVTDDPSAAIELCLAGAGLFQSLELGLAPWLERGALIAVLADWSHETYPLYAYHPSRHLPPAKVQAFLDFVQGIAAP